MSVRMTKAWRAVDSQALLALPGQLGVFQLADADGRLLFIGRADGRSTFGLRGVVADATEKVSEATQFRYEVTTAYHTRYLELLMVAVADNGSLPPANDPAEGRRLGRLSPS